MTGREELLARLTLSTLPELGPRRLRALLAGRSAAEACELLRRGVYAPLVELDDCSGVDMALLRRWTLAVGASEPAQILDRHCEAGVRIASAAELATPPWAEDPEPPSVLFAKGPVAGWPTPCVGIVGTRRCTAYGRSVAEELGRELAQAGVAVVSGLASGVDGAAQTAALDAGGVVVGVAGTGLDQVYPRRNAELWRRVAGAGLLVSEYPLGVGPARWRFPARNRLIAALSDVVVVVESPPRGGSMYTVAAALERDRSVMAVPGSIRSRTSEGPNRLIAEGAAIVRDTTDVLLELGHDVPGTHTGRGSGPASPEPSWLLDAFADGACSVDELVLRTGRELGQVLTTLTDLQAKSVVAEHGGWWERVG